MTPFETLHNPMNPYAALSNPMEPYGTLWNPTMPYATFPSFMKKLFGTLWPKYFQTLWNLRGLAESYNAPKSLTKTCEIL